MLLGWVTGDSPNSYLYGELTRKKRPQHKPRKRFKDVLKSNLKELEIDVDDWETLTKNRVSYVAVSNESGWSTLN